MSLSKSACAYVRSLSTLEIVKLSHSIAVKHGLVSKNVLVLLLKARKNGLRG